MSLTSTTSSWRKSPFETGKSYVVLKDFNSTSGVFRLGETLKFSHEEWLIDQSLTSYFFTDKNEDARCLEVYDEDDLGRWSQVFAPANPNPPPFWLAAVGGCVYTSDQCT